MKIRYQFGGVSINSVGVKLTPSVWRFLKRKAENLFRRYPRLLGLRIDLKKDTEKNESSRFLARTRLVLPGYDRFVEKQGEELHSVISKTMEVANRQLRRRNRLRNSMKRARRSPHFV